MQSDFLARLRDGAVGEILVWECTASSYCPKSAVCPFLPHLACFCLIENFPKPEMMWDSERKRVECRRRMLESRLSGSVRAKAEWLSYSTYWSHIAFSFTIRAP
jgi:hypothetical protein